MSVLCGPLAAAPTAWGVFAPSGAVRVHFGAAAETGIGRTIGGGDVGVCAGRACTCQVVAAARSAVADFVTNGDRAVAASADPWVFCGQRSKHDRVPFKVPIGMRDCIREKHQPGG